MGIKDFIDKNSAKFSEILSKIVSSFAQLSPYLLFATATIASGGTSSLIAQPLDALINTIVGKVILDYPIQHILDKLIGKESLSQEELQLLRDAVKKLSEQLEESSEQNINLDSQIMQFTGLLVNSPEFKNLAQNIKDLNSKIETLKEKLSNRLAEIKEELDILRKVNLPKVETILERGAPKSPEFFRMTGPLWVDFQEGCVYERPEVDSILNELKEKKIVVIKGNPASGKSVILKNIGYKLANEGADVFFVKLRGSGESWQANEIYKMCHGYVLIEDAHLNINFIESLLLNKPKAKVVISCRNINLEEIFGPTSEYRFSEYLKVAIEIKASNAVYKIIKKFEDKKGKIPFEERVKLIRHNLWVTGWQLKSYEKYNKVDEEKVLEMIKRYIKKLKRDGVQENILLLISAFYRYEIAPRKSFIEDLVNTKTIHELEELNEISIFTADGKDYVALYHLEIANIYLKAFEKFDDFGREAKNKIRDIYRETFKDGENYHWLIKIFNVYLKDYPDESINVLDKLALGSLYGRDNGVFSKKDLLNAICSRNLDEIIGCFEHKKYDEKIGKVLRLLRWKHKEVFIKIVNVIDTSDLLGDIENASNIEEINRYIFGLLKISFRFTKIILNKLNLANLIDKANKDCDYWNIIVLIENIEAADKDFAKCFVEKLNVKSLVKKLDEEEDLTRINVLFEKISKLNKKNIATNILKQMDAEKLKEKIYKIQDPWLIISFTSNLAKIDKTTAEWIFGEINYLNLIEHINMEKNIWEIKRFISKIAELNISVALKVMRSDKFDIKHIVDGINCEYNIWKIKRLLNEISKIDKNITGEIAERLDLNILIRKINNEKGVRRIAGIISELGDANKNVAKTIVEKIDKRILIQKIDKEENILGMQKLVKAIRNVDERNLQLILDAIEEQKREKISKTIQKPAIKQDLT